MRFIVFLLIGLGIAGIGVAGYIATRPPPPAPTAEAPPPPVAQTAQVLVASRPIRAGSLLGPEDLAAKDVDVAAIPSGAAHDGQEARAALRGAMVRHSLESGQIILQGDVLSPGDRGFLAAVLAPGARAVTVAVDAVSGTAGLIWPGDRVDLILTQAIEGQDQPMDKKLAGEVVLADVRVIAVDQQLMQGGQSSGVMPQNNRTVTLEVSPRDAEKVAVGSQIGHLALAVRSATPITTANADPDADPGIVWSGDVSSALRDKQVNKTGLGVKVFKGGEAAVEYKF